MIANFSKVRVGRVRVTDKIEYHLQNSEQKYSYKLLLKIKDKIKAVLDIQKDSITQGPH